MSIGHSIRSLVDDPLVDLILQADGIDPSELLCLLAKATYALQLREAGLAVVAALEILPVEYAS